MSVGVIEIVSSSTEWAAALTAPRPQVGSDLAVLNGPAAPDNPPVPTKPDTPVKPDRTQPAPAEPSTDPHRNPDTDPGGEPCPGPCTW